MKIKIHYYFNTEKVETICEIHRLTIQDGKVFVNLDVPFDCDKIAITAFEVDIKESLNIRKLLNF